jgi:hypothetical protein
MLSRPELNRDGLFCERPLKELSYESGMHKNTIVNTRTELVAAGLVTKAEGHKHRGTGRRPRYRILTRVKDTSEARQAAAAFRRRAHAESASQRRLRERRETALIMCEEEREQLRSRLNGHATS